MLLKLQFFKNHLDKPRMAVKNVTLLSLKLSSKKHKLFKNISTNSFWIEFKYVLLGLNFNIFPSLNANFIPAEMTIFVFIFPIM